MATKKFEEVRGVTLRKEGDDEDHLRRFAYNGQEKDYRIVSRGDVIFVINPKEMTIETCTVKMRERDRSGMIDFYYCDAANLRDFIPTENNYYHRNLPTCLKCATVMYNKSSYGLLFTNMNDALKKLEKIEQGKYFGALKAGDIIYMVDKANNKIT